MNEAFEAWAIVELFGHQKIAGKLTEQTIGGCNFIRVDAPAFDGSPAFTKLYTQGAIYGVTFVSERIARAAARCEVRRPGSDHSAIPSLAGGRLIQRRST